jgi:hypothetical protein
LEGKARRCRRLQRRLERLLLGVFRARYLDSSRNERNHRVARADRTIRKFPGFLARFAHCRAGLTFVTGLV